MEETLEKKKQGNLKTLSKFIYVLAKIGKIFTIIGIVAIAIGLSIAIAVTSNIEIKAKDSSDMEIKFADQTIQYRDKIDKVTLKISGGEETEIEDKDAVQGLRMIAAKASQISMKQVVLYLVALLIFTVATMVLSAIMLNYVEKLFKNISKEDTPFIMENVEYIKKIGWFMVASAVVSAFGNGVANGLISGNSSFSASLSSGTGFNLVLILTVFASAIIVEYGCKLQEKSNAKIYDSDVK